MQYIWLKDWLHKVPQLMTQCKGRKSLGPLEATHKPIRVYLLIAYKYAQKLRRYSPWPLRIFKRICEKNTPDTARHCSRGNSKKSTRYCRGLEILGRLLWKCGLWKMSMILTGRIGQKYIPDIIAFSSGFRQEMVLSFSLIKVKFSNILPIFLCVFIHSSYWLITAAIDICIFTTF